MTSRCELDDHSECNSTIQQLNLQMIEIKQKNMELATALSESQKNCYQAIKDRDAFQAQLFAVNLQHMNLFNRLKKVKVAAQASVNTIVSLSNHLTDMLEISSITSSPKIDRKTYLSEHTKSINSSPTSILKMQAVKPMIDGHVIFRPTINLPRVTALQLEESQRQNNNLNNDFNERRENVISEQFQQFPVEDNARLHNHFRQSNLDELNRFLGDQGEDERITNGDGSSQLFEDTPSSNRGLDVISEETEPEVTPPNTHTNTSATPQSISLSSRNSEMPLFSGIFKEVRVYLSPMDKYVTNERGKSNSCNVQTSESIHSAKCSASNINHISRNINNPFVNLRKKRRNNENLNVTNDSAANNSMNQSDMSNSNSVLHSTPTNSKGPTESFRQLSNNGTVRKTFNWQDLSNNLNDSRQKQNSTLKTDNKQNVKSNNQSTSITNNMVVSDDLFEDVSQEGPSTLLDSSNSKTNFLTSIADEDVAIRKPYCLRNASRRANKMSDTEINYVFTRQRKKMNFSTSSPKEAKIVLQRIPISPLMSPIQATTDADEYSDHRSDSKKHTKKNIKKRKKVKNTKINSLLEVDSTESPLKCENIGDAASNTNKRPKRNVKQVSMKEPTLRKKLRRSP